MYLFTGVCHRRRRLCTALLGGRRKLRRSRRRNRERLVRQARPHLQRPHPLQLLARPLLVPAAGAAGVVEAAGFLCSRMYQMSPTWPRRGENIERFCCSLFLNLCAEGTIAGELTYDNAFMGGERARAAGESGGQGGGSRDIWRAAASSSSSSPEIAIALAPAPSSSSAAAARESERARRNSTPLLSSPSLLAAAMSLSLT